MAMHILITAGGTREYIDPVRFISNASSGRMGYALARAALKAGHAVTLITAPTALKPPAGAKVVAVESAAEMFAAVKEHFSACDCLIMAAAVADYTPAKPSKTKLKKEGGASPTLQLQLKPTADILKWAGRNKTGPRATGHGARIVVGFALEDRNLRANAERKMRDKHLDMIVANAPDAIDAETSTVHIKILDADWLELADKTKETIARRIITLIERVDEMSEDNTDGRTASTITPDASEGPTLFKYFSNHEDVIRGIFLNSKIRFTQPAALNDPLEFNPTIRFKNRRNYRWFRYHGIVFPSEEWWVRVHLIERRINEFGILSLSKIYDSFDMWSRYANGHKGFLLALKSDFNEQPCLLSRDGRPYPVEKVDYVDECAIDIEELVDDQGNLREELAHKQLFFRKVSRWQAEEEYRMVRPLSDLSSYAPLANKPHRDDREHLFDFSLDCVEAVLFGACMSKENKRQIMRACEGLGIHFGQALIVRDEREKDTLGGKTGKVKILPIGQFPQLMDMCSFTFILDARHFDDQHGETPIAKLSELPYWEDDREWIEWYYAEKKREGGKSPAMDQI
ncbi:MAG: DUF2971 domain-containing protein [Sedimentisphaerales bacterium]|nr:DUF2971 domain-containing protein [Sedimentisphaerales bacterium]